MEDDSEIDFTGLHDVLGMAAKAGLENIALRTVVVRLLGEIAVLNANPPEKMREMTAALRKSANEMENHFLRSSAASLGAKAAQYEGAILDVVEDVCSNAEASLKPSGN
ncbi:MAG: hypothetical protein Q8R82_05290 [Hyphomonadaceae bacterium]|nr:hypothetical protein [Hyphomonadaceae bacterium]